jgi:hypothetical protein
LNEGAPKYDRAKVAVLFVLMGFSEFRLFVYFGNLEGSRFNGSRFGGLEVWELGGLGVRRFGFSDFSVFGCLTAFGGFGFSEIWRVRGLMVQGLGVRRFGFSNIEYQNKK